MRELARLQKQEKRTFKAILGFRQLFFDIDFLQRVRDWNRERMLSSCDRSQREQLVDRQLVIGQVIDGRQHRGDCCEIDVR